MAIGHGLVLAALIPAWLGVLAILTGSLAGPVGGVAYAIGDHHAYRLLTLAVSLAGAVFVVPLLVLVMLTAVRRLANLTRALVGEWSGIPIRDSYRPQPERGSRLRWMLADPATWRDLLWIAVNLCAGPVLLLGPALMAGLGTFAVLRILVGQSGLPASYPAPVQFVFSAALAGLGLWLAPVLLHGYGYLARWLLAPPGSAEMARRVRHLTQTRAETIDAGAAEIRRIERDLHDGAQARLVALGMSIGMAEQKLANDPQGARELLEEARQGAGQALKELRDLARGIHPPVLADRGLEAAVIALADASPIRVKVLVDVPRRPAAPVESAAYFVVAEALANAGKHAGATRVDIRIVRDEDLLTVEVSDDGGGGANPSGGGLSGLRGRVEALDGKLRVASPPGGPTLVRAEMPCGS
jgi:signal transduction histidine kinase